MPTFNTYKGRTLIQMKIHANEQASEIARLRAMLAEVVEGDWTDAAYAIPLASRLAETGWFKRVREVLVSRD